MSFLQKLLGNLKALAVFWPSWMLVVILYLSMIHLSQGQDILQATTENNFQRLWGGFALAFASFTVWYSARLYGFTQLEVLGKGKFVSIHFLRFLAYLTYSVIILGLMKLLINTGQFGDVFSEGLMEKTWVQSLLLLSISIGWYCLWFKMAKGWKSKDTSAKKSRKGLSLTLASIGIGILLGTFLPGHWGMIIGLVISQTAMAVLMFMRGHWSEALSNGNTKAQEVRKHRMPGLRQFLTKQVIHVRNAIMDLHDTMDKRVVTNALKNFDDNLTYTLIFNMFAVFSAFAMGLANWFENWATAGGSLTWILIGFTGIIGTINLVRSVARAIKVNLFGFVVVTIFLAGFVNDPHEIHLITSEKPTDHGLHSEDGEDRLGRLSFRDEISAWKKHAKQAKTNKKLVFVMSDGGALRSAYWVSSVLERLDEDNSPFGDEVFCFAGASGGSIGNATYYAPYTKGAENPGAIAKAITQKDYFSYTAAVTLGHDMLNQFIPIFHDRGRALERGYANAADDVWKGFDFNTSIAKAIPNKSTKWAPILTMNSTRMEDARPALISTMNLQDTVFEHRPDVLFDLEIGKELRYASAAMMSARFPYLSPAGGIPTNKELDPMDYFVDGGYLDNSGAGIILEMLMEFEHLKKQDPALSDVKPYVIHLTNSSPTDSTKKKSDTHPLTNNLAAPIKAIVGSYAEQTDILSERLTQYLAVQYPNEDTYIKLNLFDKLVCDTCLNELSYNWMMSNRTKADMDARLDNAKIIADLQHIRHVLGR